MRTETPNQIDQENKEEVTALTQTLADNANQLQEKLGEYLQTARQEVDFAAKVLENSSSKFEDKLSEQLAAFEQAISESVKQTFALRKLPDKIGDCLHLLIPEIAAQVQKTTFQNIDAALGNTRQTIDQLTNKIHLITIRIEDLSSDILKKKLKPFALTLLITMLASASLTYAVLRYFPQKIMIDTNGDVNIEGGNVSIWGANGNKVQINKQRNK